jgi:hypothetical protein
MSVRTVHAPMGVHRVASEGISMIFVFPGLYVDAPESLGMCPPWGSRNAGVRGSNPLVGSMSDMRKRAFR